MHARFLAAGLCWSCGEKPLPDRTRCAWCVVKNMALKNLGSGSNKVIEAALQKFKDQDGKCFYTGVELVLGANATMDHVLPKERFSKHRFKIDNIVWCDSKINRMKTDMTLPELISACKMILEKHGS